MATLVMSDAYPDFCRAMEQKGHRVAATDAVAALPAPEQRHADLQLLRLRDRLFILSECTQLREVLRDYQPTVCVNPVQPQYPNNIALNFLYQNHKLFGRPDFIDPQLKAFCDECGIETVYMKQGYARCTTLALSNHAAITADNGVQKTLAANGVDVLLIDGGGIRLEGYDKGFIGGASCVIENTAYFFGNAAALKDYAQIIGFCGKYGFSVQSICPGIPLTDIGGAVVL